MEDILASIRRIIADNGRIEEAVPAEIPPPPPPETARAGRTLEEVVREALEPMLRAWLDRNLQEIVERRVQQEIDRISRKSES